jgi:hypothetical protein
MDIRLPDGTILRGVPEGTTKQEVAQRLRSAGRDIPESWLTEDRESRGKNAPGAVRGLLSVAQGPTFGFADELVGAGGGVMSALRGDGFRPGYLNARDYARGAAKQEQETNPVTTALTRGAASLPVALKGFAIKGAGALRQMIAAGKTGVAYGGLHGLGASESESVGGLAKDTAVGASISGALGSGTALGARMVGGIYNAIAPNVSNSAAARIAQSKLAEQLARDARGNAARTSPQAALSQTERALQRLGPEGRVVDAGGANTRQLLDTLTILPGRTKEMTEQAIRSRQSSSATRLIEAAERAFKTEGKRLAPSIKTWAEERAQASQPLYERLYRVNVNPDQELSAIVRAADDLGATSLAKNIATARQLPYSLDLKNTRSWSMRDLDHMKQALDSQIARKVNPLEGRLTPEGAALVELRNNLTRKLDAMTQQPNGESLYRSARDAFSGPSQIMDSARRGQAAMNRDEASIRSAMEGLNASEVEAFRLGAFEALRSKLGMRGGRTEIINMWQNPATAEKLKAVFGDERAFRQFAASAAAEGRMRGLESVGRGSQTAARQYASGDLDVPALADASRLATGQGGIMGMLDAGSRTWNRVAMPEPVRDQMGQSLLRQGPAARQELQAMEEIMRQVMQSRQGQANAFGLLGAQPVAPLLGGL